MKKNALSYFEYFSKKDVEKISDMFDEDIRLRDWDIIANGKANVVLANAKIFDNVKSININPLNIYQDGLVICADLEITINNTDLIRVVDILEFSRNGKILSIRAYKG